MDTDTTETPAPPAEAPVDAPTPDAPWGINPRTGKPYRRDPALFAHLKGQPRGSASKRPARRRKAPTPTGPVSPAPSTRPAPAGKRPAYGKRAVELGKVGLMLVPDPVDREIVLMQLAALGPIVDSLCAESPTAAAFMDRYIMRMTGGAKVDLAVWVATTGGMLAMNHGVHHPMLAVLLGAGLEQARAQAAATAKAAQAYVDSVGVQVQDQVPAPNGYTVVADYPTAAADPPTGIIVGY